MNTTQDPHQMQSTLDENTKQMPKRFAHDLNSDPNSSQDQNQQHNCLKVSTSTKPSILFSSSNTVREKTSSTRNSIKLKKSAYEQNKVQKRQSESCSEDLRKLTINDEFSCQNCSHQLNSNCEVCRGKSRLNGNDKIIKFFEYLLEFKLGRKQSYRSKQENLSKRNNPNQHCNLYFSTINPKVSKEYEPQHKVRFSINNDVLRSNSITQSEQGAICRDIHQGFNCNQCKTEPIQGIRYHCNDCDDFDLCEGCFLRVGHFHNLKPIELKGNRKPSEIINILKNSNPSSLRSSIRNSTAIRSSVTNKTCKSWIR